MTPNSRYIFDTNILVSAFLVRRSISSVAVEKGIQNGILYFTNETFAEFQEVIFRRKFDKYVTLEERIQIIERIEDKGNFIIPISNNVYCRDPKDDKFLNLAIDISAHCIISGDNDLLILHPFKNIPIINATEFVMSY